MKLKIIILLIVFFGLFENTYAWTPTALYSCAVVVENQISNTTWTFPLSVYSTVTLVENFTFEPQVTLPTGNTGYYIIYSLYGKHVISGEWAAIDNSGYKYYNSVNPLTAPGIPVQSNIPDTSQMCPAPEPCQAERAAAIAACPGGTEDYVDWSSWSYETCSTYRCCPTGVKLFGSCVWHCPYFDDREPGILKNYGAGLCQTPACSQNEIVVDGKCKHNCTLPSLMDLVTGNCTTPDFDCGPCETKTESGCIAPAVCPSLTYMNFETCQCTDEKPPDCGMNKHWNGVSCVADEVTRCSPVEINGVMTEQVKNVDGDCIPVQTPTVKPTTDPVLTPEENNGAVLGAIKDDTGKLIVQGNETNKYLSSLDENTQIIVKNQGVINENIKKNTTDITSTLNNNADGIINAIQGLEAGLTVGEGEPLVCPSGYQLIGNQCEKTLVCPEGYQIIGNDCSEILPEYTEEGLGNTVGAYTVGDYNGRYTAMVNNIKSGPLATMLTFGSIPSGASAMTIPMPEMFGGDQSFDFANFDNAWSILRAALLVIFSFIFIRIVFLKR